MRKIISIITALSLMAAAVSAAAAKAENISADEVEEMIITSGLSSYPELWDRTIHEVGKKEDVMSPETRAVKDVIDVDNSYRMYYVKNEDGRYFVSSDNSELLFCGYDNRSRYVQINAFEDDPESGSAGTVNYIPFPLNGEDDDVYEKRSVFTEDYKAISEIINNSSIPSVREIKIVSYETMGVCIYIMDKSGNEYAISAASYSYENYGGTDPQTRSAEKGEVLAFKDWCTAVDTFEKNTAKGGKAPQFEEIVGDEIRDTDTRAAYIGTESKFSDVSGYLASYVNELHDLGIINGYENGLFMPENTITRAEAAAMLARMLKCSGSYNGEFKDVDADDWFADDVSALAAAGIVNGYENGGFAPYEQIKYQEIMKILVYALGYGEFIFLDGSTYPSATDQKAMEIGLTKGISSFATAAPITRGDMAVMLSNALDTHLLTTVKMQPQNNVGGAMGKPDITLIDYISGRKLNGNLPKGREKY